MELISLFLDFKTVIIYLRTFWRLKVKLINITIAIYVYTRAQALPSLVRTGLV